MHLLNKCVRALPPSERGRYKISSRCIGHRFRGARIKSRTGDRAAAQVPVFELNFPVRAS